MVEKIIGDRRITWVIATSNYRVRGRPYLHVRVVQCLPLETRAIGTRDARRVSHEVDHSVKHRSDFLELV